MHRRLCQTTLRNYFRVSNKNCKDKSSNLLTEKPSHAELCCLVKLSPLVGDFLNSLSELRQNLDKY